MSADGTQTGTDRDAKSNPIVSTLSDAGRMLRAITDRIERHGDGETAGDLNECDASLIAEASPAQVSPEESTIDDSDTHCIASEIDRMTNALHAISTAITESVAGPDQVGQIPAGPSASDSTTRPGPQDSHRTIEEDRQASQTPGQDRPRPEDPTSD